MLFTAHMCLMLIYFNDVDDFDDDDDDGGGGGGSGGDGDGDDMIGNQCK